MKTIVISLLYAFHLISANPEASEHRSPRQVPNPECGVVRPGNLIVGGHDATLGQFPWMAIIGLKDGEAFYRNCGGSIINNRYVLTAAHCVLDDSKRDDWVIRLGEHDLNTTEDCTSEGVCAPPVQEFKIETLSVHGEFGFLTLENDIALLRLDREVNFNDYVSPVCLPTSEKFVNETFLDQTMDVAGWGRIDGGELKSVLQTAEVTVVPQEQCDYKRSILSNKQLCAGEEGRGACYGDSGGPLMGKFTDNSPLKYFQIGIVSGGHEICASKPGYFTKVPEYITWISDTVVG